MNRYKIDDKQQGFTVQHWELSGFPGGSVVKNPPANAGDVGLIPGWGRSVEEEMETHFSIIPWKIPQTEEPRGLQSMGS